MDSIDKMLNELNDVTNMTSLLESSDFGVNDLFNKFQRIAFGNTSNISICDNEMNKLVAKSRSISITSDYMLITHSTINTDIPYRLDGDTVMRHIFSEIYKSVNNGKLFNKCKVVNEAISLAYSELVGSSPKKEMSITMFKTEYLKQAHGSRIQIVPNIEKLSSLANKIPFKINYIQNISIRKYIRNLNSYSNELIANFERLLKNYPELENNIKTYKEAINDGVESLMIIYKSMIRNLEYFYIEYKRIFDKIISINERIATQNESIIANIIDNKNFAKNILHESHDDINMNIDNSNETDFANMLSYFPKNRRKNLESLHDNMYYIYNVNEETLNNLDTFEYSVCENVIKPIKHINIDKLFNIFDNIDSMYENKSDDYIMKSIIHNLEMKNISEMSSPTIIGKLREYIVGNISKINKDNISMETIDIISKNCIGYLSIMNKIDDFLNSKEPYLKQLTNNKKIMIYYMMIESIFSNLFIVINESQILCKTLIENK